MAFRKATIREQFDGALAGVLEPGERVQAGVLTQSGPTPWLTGAIGIVMMLMLGMRYYFVTVTDRRVIFMRASLLSVRPQGLDWADARGAGIVSEIDADAALWSHFKYRRPADGKEMRFNVHRMWRDELREVLLTMNSPEAQIPPPPPFV
jgi:hypothetical protein